MFFRGYRSRDKFVGTYYSISGCYYYAYRHPSRNEYIYKSFRYWTYYDGDVINRYYSHRMGVANIISPRLFRIENKQMVGRFREYLTTTIFIPRLVQVILGARMIWFVNILE